MLRTFRVGLVAVAATLLIAPLVSIIALFRSHSPLVDRLIRAWARCIIAAAGIDLTATGGERLDPDRRYIFVANHHSYLDIPCLLVAVPQPLRFMAKVSLFKIPIFGWGLKATGFIPVDRKNRKMAVKSFDLAGERIRGGNSIVIFPEEGRSRERMMRPFQRGAFLLALRAKLPLVPAAIDGTFDAFPATRWSIRPGPVTVTIGEPIETTGISIRTKDELMDRSRSVIESMLGHASVRNQS